MLAIKWLKYDENFVSPVDNGDRTETVTRYKVNQLIDTGMSITLSLTEDVELERVSQQQTNIGFN